MSTHQAADSFGHIFRPIIIKSHWKHSSINCIYFFIKRILSDHLGFCSVYRLLIVHLHSCDEIKCAAHTHTLLCTPTFWAWCINCLQETIHFKLFNSTLIIGLSELQTAVTCAALNECICRAFISKERKMSIKQRHSLHSQSICSSIFCFAVVIIMMSHTTQANYIRVAISQQKFNELSLQRIWFCWMRLSKWWSSSHRQSHTWCSADESLSDETFKSKEKKKKWANLYSCTRLSLSLRLISLVQLYRSPLISIYRCKFTTILYHS